MQIESFNDYKTYETSPIIKAPSHWRFSRLRFQIQVNPVKSEVKDLPDDTIVSFIPMEALDINGNLNLENEKHLSDVYSGYTFFREEDILIAKITPCFENGKGGVAQGLRNKIGFGTTEFHVLRPRTDCDKKWLYYISNSHLFRNFGTSEMLGAGGQKRVPEEFIKNFQLCIPPVDEQIKIAAFLDYKTAQIDQLIEKKKQLIEKLNEKRIAVITQAVTKGLDPNVPMKDSGIEWLGQIPAHWDVRRLKFQVQLFNEKINSENTSLPYLGMENVSSFTGVRIYDDNDPPVCDSIGNIYQENDVLFGKLRPYLAKIYKAKEEGYCSTEFLVLKSENVDPHFLFYWLTSDGFLKLVNSSTYGTKMPRASWDYIGNLPCPHLSLDEQRTIAQTLDIRLSKIDKLLAVNMELIGNLEEYKASLINSAVTGKIDVRKFEIPESEVK